MEKLNAQELREKIYKSKYSDAYCLVKNNIDLLRDDDIRSDDEVFNAEMWKYFKTIKDKGNHLKNYQSGLLNINFFNRYVALYLLDGGVDINSTFDPVFSSGCRIKDKLVCTANDSAIIRKVLEMDNDAESINLYRDGDLDITPVGAYLRADGYFDAQIEAYRKIDYLLNSEEFISIMDRFRRDGYCVLNAEEDKYVHYFHNMIVDIDNNIEDDKRKKEFITTMLYAFDYPLIEQETLPIIKSVLGDILYDAYRFRLEEGIKEGTKQLVKVTKYNRRDELFRNKCSVMEKATSFAFNVTDEDVKKYIKSKEVR